MRPIAGLQRILKKSFRTLPSRISLFVFGTTFLTTVACAYITISSFQTFLDERIDEKFPSVLMETSNRIERWYEVLAFGLESYSESGEFIPEGISIEEFREASSTLSYRQQTADQLAEFLMNSTRFAALFILDEKGDEIAWAGKHPTLTEEILAQLAAIETSSISNLLRTENERVQFISIPLINEGGDKVASLHALVDLKVLIPLLQSDQIGESGRIYLLDEAGRAFITEQFQDVFEQSPPELWSKPHVQRYQKLQR